MILMPGDREKMAEMSIITDAELSHPTNKALLHIGFWRSSKNPSLFDMLRATAVDDGADSRGLYHPALFVDEAWDLQERRLVAAYLRCGYNAGAYYGWSDCRICAKHNGSLDLSDDVYLWPEGFTHYVDDHAVKPAQSFIDHVKKQVQRMMDHAG